MILGSHNSWTFRSPDKWYFKPFIWITRCQNKDIVNQLVEELKSNLSYKTYYFDLRLRYDTKKDKWFIAHGAMTFGELPFNDLFELNYLAKTEKYKVYVRVILEYNKAPKNEELILDRFKEICDALEKTYPHITFVGGHTKYRWSKIIYQFPEKEPKIIDAYSSMQGNKLDDLWPWLWAKKHNQEFIDKYRDTDEIVLMDFI